MFLIIIETFSEFFGIDVMEMMRTIFSNQEACKKMKLQNPIFYENFEKVQAA
jgi:hypothetical protein